jgi:thiamine pyrophosphokinase
MDALVFANGDPQPGLRVRETIAAMPHACIIAADGGARVAAFYGLTPHSVIGDMDSIDPAQLAALAAGGAEIIRHSPHKDETDLELALLLAAERGARHIRVIGAIGDRLDQTISNVLLFAMPPLRPCDVRLVAGEQEAWLLVAAERTETTGIDGALGDTLSLLPLGGLAAGVRTEGLRYPLHDEPLAFGYARGVSNVLEAAQARVHLRSGALLLVHTRGQM